APGAVLEAAVERAPEVVVEPVREAMRRLRPVISPEVAAAAAHRRPVDLQGDLPEAAMRLLFPAALREAAAAAVLLLRAVPPATMAAVRPPRQKIRLRLQPAWCRHPPMERRSAGRYACGWKAAASGMWSCYL